MFSQIIIILFSFFITFPVLGKTLSTISYKTKKGVVNIKITVKEFTKTYNMVKKLAANTPPAKQFFQEYIRYRVGLEHAYNDTRLIKNTAIKNMFADPFLKEGFEQLLYKTLAENRLEKVITKIEKQTKKLSKKAMLKYYKKYPEFNINFIIISFPVNSNAQQIKTARKRAHKIYKEVKKSKKSFIQLIDLYSDDRISGKVNRPRSRNTIYPTIYAQLKKMRNKTISAPIKTSFGFYIVKLNAKIPFKKANKQQIKTAFFDKKKSQALRNSFNRLKSKYKIKFNQKLLNNIH